MDNKYPRVLIIGQVFHCNTGAGVTLSNLFKDWPDENLAIAAFNLPKVSLLSRSINNFYLIGNKEIKVVWPLNLLLKIPDSGIKTIQIDADHGQQIKENSTKRKNYFYKKKVYRFFGYTNHKYHFHISNEFTNWIADFNPDVIYSPLGNLDFVELLIQLKEETKRKIAIHIWDDWPNSIFKHTLTAPFLEIMYKKRFAKLIGITDICLSISEAMSDEYQQRYGRTFIPFHNPVEVKEQPVSRQGVDISSNRLMYMGKINKDTDIGLKIISDAVEIMNHSGCEIKFHIYTPSQGHPVLRKIKVNPNTSVFKTIGYDEIMKKLSESLMLILPLNFSGKSIEYTRLSMPTKATEYMASGRPVIVYAPAEIAIAKHVKKYEWAFLIDHEGKEALKDGITQLMLSMALQEKITRNALKLAREKYDATMVREEFRKALAS